MREIVFVTGGARSGKSRFAQAMTERWDGRLLYVATGEGRDDEMRRRIAKHREDRGPRWDTREEPLDLAAALGHLTRSGCGGGLVDCLTLWTSNLLEESEADPEVLHRRLAAFWEALDAFGGRLCLVTNEVGLGIVPENALARRFRDLAGRVNQEAAARATEAFLVVSGLPVRLKGPGAPGGAP